MEESKKDDHLKVVTNALLTLSDALSKLNCLMPILEALVLNQFSMEEKVKLLKEFNGDNDIDDILEKIIKDIKSDVKKGSSKKDDKDAPKYDINDLL